MGQCAYSLVIPGGNPTVLLIAPDIAEQAAFAAACANIMERLEAEQVGALFPPSGSAPSAAMNVSQAAENATPGLRAALPRLVMMGGEFCVNATRAAAAWLARENTLATRHGGTWGGALEVSGALAPVQVAVALSEEELFSALTAYGTGGAPAAPVALATPASTLATLAAPASTPVVFPHDCESCYAAACVYIGQDVVPVPVQGRAGAFRLDVPGISHVLLSSQAESFPGVGAWRAAAALWRERAGLAKAEASGVIWYEALASDSFAIHPAVAVAATASEHLETACGSASLALAACEWQAQGRRFPVNVRQPSGRTLSVLPAGEDVAWIAGPCSFTNEGTVIL